MARNSLKNVLRLIETARETLSPEQDFLNDLKRSIELTANKEVRLPSKTYKPGELQAIYWGLLHNEERDDMRNVVEKGQNSCSNCSYLQIP